MGTRTESDLITKILEKLAVVPEGQAPEVEDTARVEANLPSLMNELAGREIVYVPDLTAIPDEWFLSLAKICAYELRNEFGVTGEAAMELSKANDEGILNLKVMTRGKPTYEPLRTTSF